MLVHRLVAGDTVEERILELQERKRALAQAATGDPRGRRRYYPRRPFGIVVLRAIGLRQGCYGIEVRATTRG